MKSRLMHKQHKSNLKPAIFIMNISHHGDYLAHI